jgi:selenocysteine lyase/cysteine desulfurase
MPGSVASAVPVTAPDGAQSVGAGLPGVAEHFAADPGFLNTASAGLPTRETLAALEQAMDVWRTGHVQPQDYDAALESCRAAFARLVQVPPDWVATGSQLSAFAGLVAAALPDGAEVVAADCDFTSVLFPFLAQEQERNRVRVRLVPVAELAGAVDERTSLVAFSAVQSCDGALADLDAVCAAATAYGARTFCDAAQAAGWLPLDGSRFDYLACSAYKWLLSPRGTAYLTVRPEWLDELVPLNASWYAGADPWDSIYGGPLRLAATARRFDVSPAWLSWVGAAPALELLESVGVAAVHAHDVGLADRFRAGLGLDPGGSAIVAVSASCAPGAEERLAAAGVRTAVRNGCVRVSFHLYNTTDDVDRALSALTA